MSARVVIVDSNYFRSLAEAELRALRAKGFVLRISLSAFIEVWTRAVEDGEPGIIYAPSRRFAPFVSPDFPIAPSGGELIRAIGGRVPRSKNPFFEANGDFFRDARRVWRDLISEKGHTAWWERSGRILSAAVKKRADHWIDLARDWREQRPEQSTALHEDTLRKIELVGHDEIQRAVFPYVVRTHGDPQLRHPPLRDRMNAYLRVMALRLFETGRGAQKATGNDAEDLIQLQHVGAPAFLMTNDTRLLVDVGRACTFQAPWIRRFVELLEDPLPRGVPWGATAINAARELPIRTRAALKALTVREAQTMRRLRDGQQPRD